MEGITHAALVKR